MRLTCVGKLCAVVVLMIVQSGCLVAPDQQAGATAGGVVGGVVGATLDQRNPWRGGVVGAAIGAVTGVTLVELSRQASGEVAVSGKAVEYRMEAGSGYYYAEPIGYEDGCRKIREKVYDRHVLVSTKTLLVCREDDDHDDRYKHKHKGKHGRGHERHGDDRD